jgi:undecaprenyl-diphosphatase
MSGADELLAAILIGLIQGITEWLPISSEAAVSAIYSLVLDRPTDEAIAYALWLHMGTAIAAIIAFRSELIATASDVMKDGIRQSSMARYLIVATLVSSVIALPLLVALNEISAKIGVVVMIPVGLALIITGLLQLRQTGHSGRGVDSANAGDAALAGIAQGVAALPGFSRSGLTVVALLSRGISRKDALVLSFMMSIPAGLGAGLFAALDDGLELSIESGVAVAVSAITGLIAIRVLLGVADRINFGSFVLAFGAFVLVGSIWRALA